MPGKSYSKSIASKLTTFRWNFSAHFNLNCSSPCRVVVELLRIKQCKYVDHLWVFVLCESLVKIVRSDHTKTNFIWLLRNLLTSVDCYFCIAHEVQQTRFNKGLVWIKDLYCQTLRPALVFWSIYSLHLKIYVNGKVIFISGAWICWRRPILSVQRRFLISEAHFGHTPTVADRIQRGTTKFNFI